MDQSRRDLMKFGGLGFLGMATGVMKTPEGILLPHNKIITPVEQEGVMVMASGYITSFGIAAEMESLPRASISMRMAEQRIIGRSEVTMDIEFEPNTLVIHEEFYDGGPKKVVIYR